MNQYQINQHRINALGAIGFKLSQNANDAIKKAVGLPTTSEIVASHIATQAEASQPITVSAPADTPTPWIVPTIIGAIAAFLLPVKKRG